MELMDDSLTHFLESSPQPIAYHIQVNICHDITLALSFLHSNGIIHRDLSSNNVLLRGNILAKVTDFGMAKLGDLNPQATRYTFTMCPGTDVYMPPEAVQDDPVYTDKIDCFSFGVIIVQTSTRQFPKPGNRRQRVEITQPGLPRGIIEVRLAEIDRRQSHISQVDPNHPLLPIALDCLKDEDSERPSAQQLCERVASLKERPEYIDSVAAAQQERQQVRQQPQQREIAEKEGQLEQLREQLQQLQQRSIREREGKEIQIEELRQQLQHVQQSSAREREGKEIQEEELRQQLQQLKQNSAREREGKEIQEKELRQQLQQVQQRILRERNEAQGQMKQQLHQLQQNLAEENEQQLEQLLAAHREESERIMTAKNERERQLESSERERSELEKELLMWRDRAKETQHLKATDQEDKRDNIKLRWREGGRALFVSQRWFDAVVEDNRVYILDANSRLWAYDIDDKCWLRLSKAPYGGSGFVILDGLPTTIGGDGTNKLMSFTLEGKWTEKFPPMPTERHSVSAVCTRVDLIVAGGKGNNAEMLVTVEILNIENLQWSTAVDLPEPLQYHSVTVCGDQLYMLGGAHGCHVPTKSVYTCSVSALLQTCTQRSLVGTLKRAPSLSNSSSGVWSKLPDLPVEQSTCVTFCGQLLAVGGMDSDNKPTTAVYMYNQATNSWNVISHMTIARRHCFAAVLPNNQLMVVGGLTKADNRWTTSDSVEFGSLY
jgi:serine/threonine protein kinase